MSDVELSTDMTVSPGRKRAQLTHLAPLANQIKEENKKVQAGMQHALKHAIRAGQLLSQCKKMVGHGGWLEWFEASEFPFKERMAQRYMSVYHRWKEVAEKLGTDGNPSSLTDLTFTDALEILTQKDKSEKRAIANTPKGASKNAGVALDNATANAGEDPDTHPVLNTGTYAQLSSDNWLTPDLVVERVQQVFGRIELDPAADDKRRIVATEHFTQADDGLNGSNAWRGSVYLNPPLATDLIDRFTGRLQSEHVAGNVPEAILIVPAITDTEWFRKFAHYARVFLTKAACGPIAGMPLPLVAIYLGHQQERFFEVFESIGDGYLPHHTTE